MFSRIYWVKTMALLNALRSRKTVRSRRNMPTCRIMWMGSKWNFWKSNKRTISELVEEIRVCQNLDELPSLDDIKSIPRGIKLIIKFSDAINFHRTQIGERWKSELPDFLVGIQMIQPEIDIVKFITEE